MINAGHRLPKWLPKCGVWQIQFDLERSAFDWISWITTQMKDLSVALQRLRKAFWLVKIAGHYRGQPLKKTYVKWALLKTLLFENILDAHYTVWVKNPPEDLWQFFQNDWEFFNQILCAYYAFLSTVDYKFLFNYLQLWWSYGILSVTTQFTFASCVQDVHQRLKCTLAFSDIFPKQLGIFSPNFTHLLNVHTYARVQIFIHLSPTLTK